LFKKGRNLISGDALNHFILYITIMKRYQKIIIIAFFTICIVAILQSCKKIEEPEVTTNNVKDITSTSATSGGNVTNNGGAEVTARGVCWGITTDPIINSNPNKTSDGTGNGIFDSKIAGLLVNTEYHVRAYATNDEGTSYGKDVKFTTYCDSPSPPVVGTITQPTCSVTTGSVVLSGMPEAGTWSLTRTPVGITTTGTGTSTTISGLPAGTSYTFTVTNASGCVSAASGNVAINAQPASPTAPVVGTITQPTCAVTTGSVALSSLPATGTWTLTRTPGGTTTTGTGTTTTVSGLPAGTTYTFTVTNASGCISSASGNVVISTQQTSPAAPVVGTITQPTCAVTTGSVALSSLPATGNWTLTRTPGGTTSTGTGTTTTVSGLPAGTTYTFTVKNASGCVSAASGNIVIGAQPTAPAATTNPATSISSTTATFNGTVNANGASTTVTFLYGKTDSYGSTATASQSPVSGSSSTSVSAGITGLSPNTEYHYQVVAENCKGQKPGSDQQFTTTSGCSDAYETNNTIATATITAFGTLGSVNYSSTIYATRDIDSDIDWYRLNITTAGIITITSYSPGYDYDISLYDANGVGIDYSLHGFEETIIYPITTTGYYYIKVTGSGHSCMTYNLRVNWGPGANTGTFTDYRDGQEYKWVYIGTQFWMAENLNIGTRINGSLDQTDNGVIEKYCYNDNESNCSTYGGLYQWDEMMDYNSNEKVHGVCPVDWHIPSDSEWKTLEMTLGMSQTTANLTGWRGSNEGGKLKAVSNLWSGANVGATNSSNFTALPSGDRVSDGTFEALGYFTDFWTSTINTETGSIWYRLLDSEHATVYRTLGNRKYGTPLRCVKDKN
jgi:uncharacterized protein (TIGR02145 family)